MRFEVVTTMPGVERDAEFRGGGNDGSSGVELVGVIRRVEEEPKVEGGEEGEGREKWCVHVVLRPVEQCRRSGRESCQK